MKRIIIDIFDDADGELKDLVKINSDELCTTYINNITSHGLQCEMKGDSKEFLEIQEILDNISQLTRKLNTLYGYNDLKSNVGK